MEIQINIDTQDLQPLVDFYTEALGYRELGSGGDRYVSIVPRDGSGPKLVFQRVAEAKHVKNRVHLDLIVGDIEAEARRFVALGATRVSEQPVVEHGCSWIVMRDPQGNELCLCDG